MQHFTCIRWNSSSDSDDTILDVDVNVLVFEIEAIMAAPYKRNATRPLYYYQLPAV